MEQMTRDTREAKNQQVGKEEIIYRKKRSRITQKELKIYTSDGRSCSGFINCEKCL